MYDSDLITQLKIFEGYRSKAYRCPSFSSHHRYTIGYGHSHNVKPDDRVDRDQAHRLLVADCNSIDKDLIASGIDFPVYKQSALVEFCFNCGLSALKKSRMWTYISNYDPLYDNMIAECFLDWCHYHKDGKLVTSTSLLERRKYDAMLWLMKI